MAAKTVLSTTESVHRRCHSWHMSSFREQPKGSNSASFSCGFAAHTSPVVNTIFPAMAAFKSAKLVRDRENAIVSNFLPFMVLYVRRNHLLVTGEWRWGKWEIIYLSLHCHHQNDSCVKMGSHFNVSLIVRDKTTRQCPQTTTFEKRNPRPFCLPA